MLRIAIEKFAVQTIRINLLIIITTLGYSGGIVASIDDSSSGSSSLRHHQQNESSSSIRLNFGATSTVLPPIDDEQQNIIYKSYDISNDSKMLMQKSAAAAAATASTTEKSTQLPKLTSTTATTSLTAPLSSMSDQRLSMTTTMISSRTTPKMAAAASPTLSSSVVVNFPNNALKTSVTTVRTYLGMHNNVTNSKLSMPISSKQHSSHSHNSETSSSSSSSGSSSSSKNIKMLALSKPQKTDAPMLNYIFDSFSTANKHHHHDQRYGPHFEDIRREGNITNITVQAGSIVQLNCRISLLQDKTVSWVKRNSNGGEEALELLTVGVHTYSGDNRFTMEFQYPSNWRLKITNAKKSDEGIYECQISTHPPRVIQINLHVNAPKVMIVDEYGIPMQEKYYEIDSTLQLSCIVRNVVMSSSVVYWSHGAQTLNYDLTRGGVSVKTELMEDGANSTLFIARINKSDSGNYTCSINSSHEYNITVHILNGESFAELHHGNSRNSHAISSTVKFLIFSIPIFIFIVHRTQISVNLR